MSEVVRLVRFAGPTLFIVGVAVLGIGFLEDQATLSLFVIFPVITATGPWSILGILLMIAGFFLFFLTWSAGSEAQPVPPSPVVPPSAPSESPAAPASGRRWGGVVFLGPIPVVFGSDPKVTRWMLLLGVLLFVALLILTVISLRGI